jgi:hypothetical protein
MPPFLIFVAAGAGLVLAGRWYRQMQRRIASDLRAAEDALRAERERVVPLEQDPATGIYRPKHLRQRAETTRH